ncbi:ribonuclease P protein component [Novimethylophilus kurashikiensis]|uniref:ribonuclease P protein component n=1 Tax=Novimethylophilus kurashikiensis TaxID=1825523 RepID=UPI0035201739
MKKTDEFSSVFSFKQRIYGNWLAAHYKPNGLEHPRIGIVVSKKVARRAVARNYMRRVLREWFRHNQATLIAVDIVIRLNKPFLKSDFSTVQAELTRISKRLRLKLLDVSGTNGNGTAPDIHH